MRVFTFAERPDLAERTDEVPEAFPEYMGHGEVLVEHWGKLREQLPELQLVLWDEERDAVIGYGRTIPTREREGLPGGVDDMVARWFGDGARPEPDVLSALVAVVDDRRRGEGLSGLLIERMRDLAGRCGFSSLIAPVRPTWKERYPLIPIGDYVGWTRLDGLPFDPWIRLHARLGARAARRVPSIAHGGGHARGVGGVDRNALAGRRALRAAGRPCAHGGVWRAWRVRRAESVDAASRTRLGVALKRPI